MVWLESTVYGSKLMIIKEQWTKSMLGKQKKSKKPELFCHYNILYMLLASEEFDNTLKGKLSIITFH